MSEYLVTDTQIASIADAIRTKGGTTEQLVFPTGFVSAVESIQTGSSPQPVPEVPEKDINFYDYDATRLYSWTLAELANKTALPDLPSHSGLICQGWNWTLEQLKAEEGPMDVGAMYITDDGKTRYYITVTEDELSLSFGTSINGSATVDWGDGTTSTLTGSSLTVPSRTENHTYAAPGDYVVTLTINSGNAKFWQKDLGNINDIFIGVGTKSTFSYSYIIRAVEIGNRVASGNYAFFGCINLEWATLPLNFDSLNTWCFMRTKIKAVFASTGNGAYCGVAYNTDLRVLSLPSNCASLYGTFNDTPADVKIPKATSTFQGQVLRNTGIKHLVISQAVGTFPMYAMYSCLYLTTIVFRADVETIAQNAFANCRPLRSVVFLGNVGTMKSAVFDGDMQVQVYDFSHCTSIPTLENSNVFNGNNINANCKIKVPAALVGEWKAATNWSTYADHIVGIGISKVNPISMIAGTVPVPVYVELLNLPSEPADFSVNVSPEGLTISDIVCVQTQLSFQINATDTTSGTFTVTMMVSGDGYSYTELFDVTVNSDGETVE